MQNTGVSFTLTGSVQCRIARAERPLVVEFVVRDFSGDECADQPSRDATPLRLYDAAPF